MDNTHRSLRFSKSTSPSEIEVFVGGKRFTLIKEYITARSEKIATFFIDNKQENLSSFLHNIDPETFELVARFCHGSELQFSSENIIPLICLSYFLGMTENHSTNNLCKQSIDFFQQRTLPSWNETLRSLEQLSDKVLNQAHKLGLVDACLESIVEKVMMDPRLLGKPMRNFDEEEGQDGDDKPNARRKLFVPDWKSEDLTVLPLVFYKPLIEKMKQHGVPLDYIVSSLCRYVKRWVFDKNMSVFERNAMREAMEALQKLLPSEEEEEEEEEVGYIIPCDFLFEMLRHSVALEASSECRDGFERRIGKQLDRATLKDFLIPFQGYAKEAKYDLGCVKRMLKHFYGSSSASNASALIRVSNLIEDFLAEVAADEDLDIHAFVALAEMSVAASLGNHANSDGIYKAIDIYLEKHRYLTDREKEDVCRVLECEKMSREARAHAVRNERLPIRVVVQVLFVEQLTIKDTVANKEFQGFENQHDDVINAESSCTGEEEEELRVEMERMSNKVVEIERQCSTIRQEIECSSNNCCITSSNSNNVVKKKSKVGAGVWKEIKRKFGCAGSVHDCATCQVKKKKRKIMQLPRF